MNNANDLMPANIAELMVVPKPNLSRDEMRQAVIDLLWGQSHVMSRVYGRDLNSGCDTKSVPSVLELIAKRPVEGLQRACLDEPSSEFGITWDDVADTHLAQVMEQLYDFAYFAVFDLRYYPHELGDETGAWWIALFLQDVTSSNSLFWQAEYSRGSELSAAQTLLQIVETANARNLLEGAKETFVQDSEVGYLSIRQLALISDFKEESLRVMANPKRKNALPIQSVSGKTVVEAEAARGWLQSKGRYTPVRAKPDSAGQLNLALAKFESPSDLCDALSEHLSAIATLGAASLQAMAAVRALYPQAYWERAGVNDNMLDAGLRLAPADLHDEVRLRELALALDLDPELLVLKAREIDLRESLKGLEAQIRMQTERG